MFPIRKAGRTWNPQGPEERLKYVDMNEKGPSIFIRNVKGLPFNHSADCLLGSCNGLLLFCTPYNYQYYVCNPTTKEFMLLPDECRHVKCLSAVLAFDPLKSVHFKVVCFFCLSEDTQLQIEIYSSKSFKWDIYTVPLPDDYPVCNFLCPLFYFCGKIYINSWTGKALCLDLNFMTVSRIMLPEYKKGNSVSLNYCDGILGTSIGRLCYTTTTGCNTQLKIWFFDDDQYDGNKWVLKHSICMLFINELAPMATPRYLAKVFPFGFSPSCDIVYVGTAKIILSYEFKSGKWKRLISMRSKEHIFSQPMFFHACCPISLNSINRSNPNSIQPSKSSEVIRVMQVDAKFNCRGTESDMYRTRLNSEIYKTMRDIFRRLPQKTLGQCKCISKTWNHLINETCVVGGYSPPTCVVFTEKTAETEERRKWLHYVDMDENSPSKFIREVQGHLPLDHSADCLLGSGNGLLLFYTPNNYQYYVCNPTTKEFMLLPDECKYTVSCLSTALVFAPRRWADHFKVISLFCTLIATELRIEMYSSKSSQWDIFTIPLPSDAPPVDMWLLPLVCNMDNVYINSRCGTALCLNLTLRSSSQIRLPEYGRKKPEYVEYDQGVLTESHGSLWYTATTRNNRRLKVWFYCDGWMLMSYNISMLRIKEMIPNGPLASVFPYGFCPTSETVYVGTGSVILSYDIKRRKCKEVIISAKTESRQFTHPMFVILPCIVSLNSLNKTPNPLQLITAASCHDEQ